jgi:hypothetical protein
VPTVIHGPRDLLRIRDLGQPYDRFRVHALRMPVLVRPRPTPRRPGSTSDATAWTEKVGRKGADCERAPAKSLDGGHSVEWSPRRSLPWFVAATVLVSPWEAGLCQVCAVGFTAPELLAVLGGAVLVRCGGGDLPGSPFAKPFTSCERRSSATGLGRAGFPVLSDEGRTS